MEMILRRMSLGTWSGCRRKDYGNIYIHRRHMVEEDLGPRVRYRTLSTNEQKKAPLRMRKINNIDAGQVENRMTPLLGTFRTHRSFRKGDNSKDVGKTQSRAVL